ncbi:MAG: DNA polymerase III subunit chi [Burkholderiaceae bacterium]
MAQVAFHAGLDDKFGYACRLLRKAYRQGRRVEVRGDAEQLARLDPLLWTFEQQEFVPHLRLRPGQRVEPQLMRTPIWLAEDARPDLRASVLVNLGPAPAQDFGRFDRVVELIGGEDLERREGRQRWRYYEAQGCKPEHVNASTPGPS